MNPAVNADISVQRLKGIGKVLAILPALREDDPHLEGIARRRIIMSGGTCPCGARMVKPNRAVRRSMARDRAAGGAIWSVDVIHQTDCPAVHPDLLARAAGGRL